MNWHGSMDAIPIFYATQNYVNQYPRIPLPMLPESSRLLYGNGNGNVGNVKNRDSRMDSRMDLGMNSRMDSRMDSGMDSRMDEFYFKYHTNMYTNYDGIVPR